MHPKTVILGGGMVGILAKFLFPEAIVLDWRKPPPGGKSPFTSVKLFGAMYLWEPLEGVPCSSFQVITTVDNQSATQESVARYKKKIGKDGDIINWEQQFRVHSTGYRIDTIPEPTGLMDIHYDTYVERIDTAAHTLHSRQGRSYSYDILISTIPLPSLLEMCGIRYLIPFTSQNICVKVAPAPLDMPWATDRDGTMFVNYVSRLDIPTYRTTDRNGIRHYEWLQNHPGHRSMGMPTRTLTPGKIHANPETPELIHLLSQHAIHPFGRFGRWETNDLLHITYRQLFNFRLKLNEAQP